MTIVWMFCFLINQNKFTLTYLLYYFLAYLCTLYLVSMLIYVSKINRRKTKLKNEKTKGRIFLRTMNCDDKHFFEHYFET